MPELIRSFIAVSVPCPADLLPVLRSLGQMGSAVKSVTAENLHLTLKFLGDIREEQVTAIGDAIADEADSMPAFAIDLAGLGAFPRPQRPSVIWAGVQHAEPLIDLATRLEKRMRTLGFPKDRYEYNPHLTLARVRRKPPPELFELLKSKTETPFGNVKIDAILLYRSELKPDGPRYSVLSRTDLAAAPG